MGLDLKSYTCLGWESNLELLSFLGLGFLLSWVGIKLRITVFLRIRAAVPKLFFTAPFENLTILAAP